MRNRTTAKMTILAAGLFLLTIGSTVRAQAPADDAGGATADSSAASGDSSAASGQESAGSSSEFNREMRSIEEEVNGLKERVFRSKATLQLLKEVVIQGASSGANATIWHINKLGNSYTVESISYFLDGQSKFSKTDPAGSIDESKEFKVFEGAVPPGDHNLTVNVRLRGNGYGIFKYVEKYQVNFKANSTFNAEEGRSCQVRVVLEKQRGLGKSFTERPNINFETRCTRQEGGSEE